MFESDFKQKSENMYRNLLLLLLSTLCTFAIQAQVVYSDPTLPTSEEEVTIFFDATQGNGGLANCNCDVYLHTGVITNLSTGPSNWLYVPTTWGIANPAWKMTLVSGQSNLYSFTSKSTTVTTIAIRNANRTSVVKPAIVRIGPPLTMR